MNLQDVEKIIEDHIDLIAVTSKSLLDAKPRASKFLIVNSILASFLREIEEELPKYQTVEDAQYAQAMGIATGKTITEKKINIACVPDYTKAREARERLLALRDWVKTHIKIFDHAHLMFRQYSRE